ncbi:MAG: PspC domain-containing protein [Firmicutes bacterium]|nr:PspC domain-containing protein [Bacillota bacterium]
MEKRLYRSRKHKMIEGVCGGIAEYFAVDPTFVRLIFVLGLFANGVGLLAYIVALIIIPLPPKRITDSEEEMRWEETEMNSTRENAQQAGERNRFIFGGILIFIGIAFFAKRYFYWFDLDHLWPVILIIIGSFIIFKERK